MYSVKNVIFSLLFGLLNFKFAQPLNCTTCLSLLNWSECQELGIPLPCTIEVANGMHELLDEFNTQLVPADPGTNVSFQCFSLHLELTKPLGGVVNAGFSQGCTFEHSNICEGWVSSLTVVQCTTCSTGDYCPSGEAVLFSSLFLTVVSGLIVLWNYSRKFVL
ncbi:uncharacterized protein LOC131685740 [Topomyia yanbarensis]|uniref:uncharacterized protein LOC131685740 n=1 Tax=Topomyia yanbarensis TaxID=2498891 RepID=UPI00273ABBB1|nr:uncharacterized protein LOC131685740 [Topomyia yanbarensis]